jgi:hypothetical protein
LHGCDGRRRYHRKRNKRKGISQKEHAGLKRKTDVVMGTETLVYFSVDDWTKKD